MTTPLRIPIEAFVLLLAVPFATQAQTLSRTPDGHPDLQGIWNSSTLTPLQRRAEFAGKATLSEDEARAYEKKGHHVFEQRPDLSPAALARVKDGLAVGADTSEAWEMGTGLARVNGVARTSLIVDPPDGKIPALTPEAKQRSAAAGKHEDHPHSVKDLDLAERCVSYSPIPILPQIYNSNFQIVQTPDTIMILSEMIHEARVIRMNASHAPPPVRLWLGDSVGHWEGDTLVIDTTNFNSKGGYHGTTTEALHVVERISRAGAGALLYRATIDDPATFTRPWTIEYPLAATTGRIFEYACHEGNTYVESALRIEREQEQTGKTK